MSEIFYEEITGQKPFEVCFEIELERVKELIRSAKNLNRVTIFKLSYAVRNWLQQGGFTVVFEDEVFEKCFNNNDFNHCECFVCRNVGKKTGTKIWQIQWPKTEKK